MHPLVKTAYDWHGGQWSPLYSFASTGGVVHSIEHRYGLLDEIALCKDGLDECAEDYHETYEELTALFDHAFYAEIGVPLEGDEPCEQ